MNTSTPSFMVYGGSPNGFLVTGGQSGTDSFVISDVGDFFVTNIMYYSTSPLLTLQIMVSVKSVFDKAVLIGLVACNIGGSVSGGNGIFPGTPLPVRSGVLLRFPMKSNISLNYTDLSGQNNTVYLAFWGYEKPVKRI